MSVQAVAESAAEIDPNLLKPASVRPIEASAR